MLLKILSCEGCGGQCCRNQPSPPGYQIFFPPPGHPLTGGAEGTPDHRRIQAMPAALRRELAEYAARLRTMDEDEAWAADAKPCFWLDGATGRCRAYEWRPSICRDFRRGSGPCRSMRRGAGVGE